MMLEVQKDMIKKRQKVIIIDYVLVTGETIKVIMNLIEDSDATVTKLIVLLELVDLKARDFFYPKIEIVLLIKV